MYPSRSPIPADVYVSKGFQPVPKQTLGKGAQAHKISAESGIVLKPETLSKARIINSKAPYPWDFDALIAQFTQWNVGKELDSVDGAFIGFVKKKGIKPH